MLSINPCNSIISYKINNPKHSYSFWGTDVSDLMSNGDKALNENRFDEALKYYSEAKEKNSEEIQVYKKLGKTYANLKKYTQAQENYQKYIDSNPSDSETLIELGEAQRKNGFYKQAQSSYEKALALEPNNDYAKRCLLEVKNDILYAYSPTAAIKEKNE